MNTNKIAWIESDKFLSLMGYDIHGNEVMEVYLCDDGTWRVWFEHGMSTDELDYKIRNIHSLEEAKSLAEQWYRKWSKT